MGTALGPQKSRELENWQAAQQYQAREQLAKTTIL